MTITCASEDQIRARTGEFHILTYVLPPYVHPPYVHPPIDNLDRKIRHQLLQNFVGFSSSDSDSSNLLPTDLPIHETRTNTGTAQRR